MINKITSKFSFYDQVGYLIVGSVALLLITFNMYITDIQLIIPPVSLQNVIVWLIIAYLLGHIVQAVTNLKFIDIILIREKVNKEKFTDYDKELLIEVRNYFGKPNWTDDLAFKHCYFLACAKDMSGYVSAFNAYYGLYRGWLLLFAVETIFLILYFLNKIYMCKFSYIALIMVITSLIITILMFNRRKRFWGLVRAKTFQNFVVFRKLNE